MDSASDVRASKMFIRCEVQRSWLENPSAVEKLNSTGVLIVAENTEIDHGTILAGPVSALADSKKLQPARSTAHMR